MREPSASLLALAEACGHPFTSGIRWPWEESRTWAVFGDRVHAANAALVTGDYAFPAVWRGLTAEETTQLARCVEQARKFLARFPPGLERHAELDVRYHVGNGTSRVARAEEGRTKQPGEWTARMDLVLVGDVGDVHVFDWKTGRQEHTTQAFANPQLRFSALAAARLFGRRRAHVALVYLDEDDARADGADFGPLELATIAHEMRELRKRLTGGPTPPVPGPHCTTMWCKLRGICAATQTALAKAYPLERPLTVTISDDEQARWTLERLPGARAALDAIDAALKEYAARKPFPLGDGRIYGKREKTKRVPYVDTPEREAALRNVLGHGADFAIRREAASTTIALIEEGARIALGEVPARGAKAALVRDALAALEAAGGLKVSKYDAVEAFKPRETT